MAHLERLFVSDGLQDRPYQTLDSHTVYKNEAASAEMREVKQTVKKEFHPITTEIHVTELRPIKLDPIAKRGMSESGYNSGASQTQMWERRLQSESGVLESKPQVIDHNYNTADFYRESNSGSQSNKMQSSSITRKTETIILNNPEMKSNTMKTVTSRNASYSGSSPGSSPAGTLSPPPVRREKTTAEFKRRDVSPDYKMTDQQVTFIDGKCTCCPYGYHVDVDFMSYCDTLSNQSYLKQLKRIQREKRKLRKSMEVYLQDQEETDGQSTLQNPMENHQYYQETTTNRLLDDIDSSVDQTLTSIESMMRTSQQYSDSGTATVSEAPRKFNTFPKKVGRQVAKELQTYNETFTATFNNSNRADSNSSLSSISTSASEKIGGYTTTETTTTKMTSMTSQQLAETMATHFPIEDGAASPQSNMANISKQSLNAIREAMAVSLQRMKDLEEQVKAIPVLQVRISVLKEEKRLLGLQMQAQKHVNTQSRGVGEDTIHSPEPQFTFPVKSPPPVSPKPKVKKTAAVGDHSVYEPYLLQEDLPSSYTTRDNSTHVFQKETIIIDRAQKTQMMLAEETKPLTRSIGVGEGNVFDDSLHIHEKELRTVIIGQSSSVGKRNVGIECRVPTRDVGISYNFDLVEKPSTRTVGITTETTALVTNVSFKSEEFTSALRNALAKNVRSFGVQVSSKGEYRDVGIQYATSAWNLRSIGVGDCSIDVEVRNPVARRSVSIDAFPDRMNRAVNTDFGWRLDAATNTVSQFVESSSSQTEDVRKYNSFTMTDRVVNYNAVCQTDQKVFAATDQIKAVGCNTDKTLTYSTGMNTVLRPSRDMGINTIHVKNSRNFGINTEEQQRRTIGVSEDRIDSFVCDLEDKNSEEEYRFEEEGIETKTVYYETTGDQKATTTNKGFEMKREYATDSYAVQSNKKSESEEEDVDTQNEEVVEEKIWRTSGDGQFTVTTITTRKVFGPDGKGDVKTETKTVTGGPEVLGADAKIIQEEVKRGRRSSLQAPISDAAIYGSSTSGFSSGSSSKSSSEFTIQELDYKQGEGATAIERVLGAEYAQHLKEENMKLQSTDLDDFKGMSDSGLSTSSEHGTVTHTTIIREGSSSPRMTVTKKTYSSDGDSPQTEFFTTSYDSGLNSSGGSGSSSSSSEVISRTVSSSSQMSYSSPSSTLKSIMKKSSSDPGGSQKRGITFAESVVGGETDDESSDNYDDDEEEDEEEEEVEENASRGTTSDSDSSFDEGSYDSREGSIVYKCKDDEAIANGIPGAKMFDQNIRETFELSGEMKEACQTLATYLEDSTTIQTKQLNASLNVIQQEWFKISSSKLAEPHQVEDFLSCFNEISKRLLEYIVNMQDSNGNTAIHYAVSNCNFEVVNLLLDTGICDLNKLNKAGYSAVIMATLASVQTQRQEEVVQRLFSMGNVNIKAEKDGQTALMFAVRQGRNEMVKMLLDTGADVNIQDDEGSTALMCASEHGHSEIIKMLLNTPGCDATISDNDGSTALSIAMEAGHKDAGVLLYAHVNFGPGQAPRKYVAKRSNMRKKIM